ncbi:short chain oxidoreductase/dehydrogenase [Blastomyces dermatitidis ER-3]|uniref:Short chain oxidoreductase/dehydrogenase n=1 Tax=Ajellomyces dermatitidis (strain ER-3 / ATCC MYA-2586) TaxID=559297 RepID=A0ABP2EWL2_AJEDR|nr:short chain oxidoreductase/dehydrogenase [Blastomyces dermatitidis ER-3]EEQ86807.2 short chain oxidoreductase/dehydrogenase [Blastomyces dermatitidis ER-3]
MVDSPVWFITGASSGFGSALAEAVLKAGNRVIASARNPEKARRELPQIEELGGKWLQLDVTTSEVGENVQGVIQEYGRIDVEINNAGYSLLGTLEDMSEAEIYQQYNTNVYGPIRVMKAVIPSMRARKSGTIVNFTSIAGLDARLACSICDPNPRGRGTSKPYEGTPVHETLQRFLTLDGKQPGDPVKAVARVMDVINGTGMGDGETGFLRLPLGPDCVQRTRDKIMSLQQNFDAMEEIALSTNFD